MKKKIIVCGIVLLVALVISPKIYKYVQEKSYYKNHIVAVTTFAEITVLDKHKKGDEYYITFNFDSQYYKDKYKIKDSGRVYQLGDKELYEKIDLSRPEDYFGLTIETIIDTRTISNEEAEKFRSDPFLILSKQEYSNHIKVVGISPSV